MVTAPLQADGDALRNAGAVFVEREGFPVVAHYGSVASEIAVCSKAAGLVDRSGLSQLETEGPAVLVGHVLAAALPDAVPEPGFATCVADTWCARPEPERAVVAGVPSAVARWRQVMGRAVAGAGLPVTVRSLSGASALSLVGPRAARVLERAGLPAGSELHGVAGGVAAGTAVTVVCEAADHFLLLLGEGGSAAAWHALLEAGRDLGVAPVGNQALELMQAAARPHL